MWLNIFNFTKYRQLAFFPEFLYQCALTMLVYFMPTFAVIFFPTFAFLVSVKCRNMHWLSTVWNIHNNCIILWIPYWLFFNSFCVFWFFLNLFIYFWLCWVFVSVRELSLVAASRGHSSSRCTGLSLSWPLLLRSTGSRCAGSAVVAPGPSYPAACGIFPDQGSNPCTLH